MFTLIILWFPYVNNPPHTCFLSVPHYCKLIYWPNNGAIKLILNIGIQGLRLLFCSFFVFKLVFVLYCFQIFFAIKSYFKFYLFYWIFSLQNESFVICHASKLLLFPLPDIYLCFFFSAEITCVLLCLVWEGQRTVFYLCTLMRNSF